MGSILNTIVNT